jgi:hypothetical protein
VEADYAEPQGNAVLQEYAEPVHEEAPAPSFDASPAAAEDDWDSDSTQMGDIGSIRMSQPPERLAAPVHAIYELPPPTAPGQLPSPHGNVAALTRARVAASWSPEPALRPDPSPSSGLFQYGDSGLPRPARAPRPQLDPSLHVVRAPRPGDPLAAPLMRSGAAAAAAVAYEPHEDVIAFAHEEDAYAAAPEDAYDAGYAAADEGYAAEDAYAGAEPVEDGGYAELGSETRQVDIGGLDDETFTVDESGLPQDDES